MLDTVFILRAVILLAFLYVVNLLLKAYYTKQGIELRPKAFAVSEKKVFVDILPIKYEFTTRVQAMLKDFNKSNEKSNTHLAATTDPSFIEIKALPEEQLKKLLELETRFLKEMLCYTDFDYMNQVSFNRYFTKLQTLLQQIVDLA